MVSSSYSGNAEPVRTPKLVAIALQGNFWRSIRFGDEEATGENYCHLFIDQKLWKVGLLDSIFRLIADDEVNETMVISVERNFVYHPYDGGADVILKDSLTRDRYKQKYEQWLSARPDGL